MKPFGGTYSVGRENGYTLPFLVGWLESLVTDEELSGFARGPRAKRLALVEDGLEKLREAMEMGNE